MQKSTVYATIIGQRIEEQRAARAKQEERAAKKGKEVKSASASGKKRKRNGDDGILDVDKGEVEKIAAAKKRKADEGDVNTGFAVVEKGEDGEADGEEEYQAQSLLITGATLRDYQLAGVQWLSTLHANGLNGILGDEMGLVSTSITFYSYVLNRFDRERRYKQLHFSPICVTWASGVRISLSALSVFCTTGSVNLQSLHLPFRSVCTMALGTNEPK